MDRRGKPWPEKGDDVLIEHYAKLGPTGVARILGVPVSSVRARATVLRERVCNGFLDVPYTHLLAPKTTSAALKEADKRL